MFITFGLYLKKKYYKKIMLINIVLCIDDFILKSSLTLLNIQTHIDNEV